MDEIVKKVLIQVEAKTETLKQNVGELNLTLDTLIQKQKAMGKQTADNSKEFVDNAVKIRLTKEEIRNTNREIDNAVKALATQSNSIAQNTALVATLTAEQIKLTQAEGEGSSKAKELGEVIKGVTDTLKGQRAALGDNKMEVGNYAIATDGLKGKLGQLTNVNGTLADATGRVSVGYKFAKDLAQDAKATFTDFTNALARHKEATDAVTVAQEQSVLLTNASIAANEKATVVGFKFAKGEATAAEAEAAKTTAQVANIAATEAQTVVTEAQTVATAAGTEAMTIFKYAMASTGIGILVIAIGSLIAYFKSTNEGAKEMKIAMGAVSDVIQVCVKWVSSFGKSFFEAITHPVDSLKALGTLIVDNVINRFKAVSVILDGIIHLDFKKMADGALQAVTGVENAAEKMQKLGSSIKGAAKELVDAAKSGAQVAQDRVALGKAEREWTTEKIKQQKEVDLLTLKLRQQTIPEKERIALAEKAKKLRENIFDTEIEHANKNLELTNKEQDAKSKKDKQAITDAKNRVEQLIANKETEIQAIENRESRLQTKLQRSGESQSALAAKKHEELMKYVAEEESNRMASLSRQAQTLLDAYGKEISSTEEYYRQLITKQKNYETQHAKQLAKEPEAKAKIDAYILQLETEKHAKMAELAEKFKKDDAAKLDKIQKELTQLTISAVTNVTEVELAQLQTATAEKVALMQKESDQINDVISKQQVQIIQLRKDRNIEEADILQKSVDNELKVLQLSGEAKVQFLANQAKKEADIRSGKAFADAKDQLEGGIIADDMKGDKGELSKLDKEGKLLDLEHNQAVTAAKNKGEATFKIEQDYTQKKLELSKKVQKTEEDLNKSKLKIADNALSLITKNISKETVAYQVANTARKAIAVRNVIVDTKEALIKTFKAYSGLPFIGQVLAIAQGAFIAGQAASSIAEINKQKFATGGVYISDGRGGALSGYSKKDNINSQLRSGEGILVSEAMRVPWARNIASAINVAFGGRDFSTPQNGGGFAIGGVYTDGGNSNRYYTQPVQDNQALANTIAYQLINNFPPIITDVKDVISQVGILTQTQNRTTI